MTATAVVEIEGHIIDSLILPKILDVIVDMGADYQIVDIDVGRTQTDQSHARLEIVAPDENILAALLAEIHQHGAHPVAEPDARTEPAPSDGVLPRGFYSTTNLPTAVKVGGTWIDA